MHESDTHGIIEDQAGRTPAGGAGAATAGGGPRQERRRRRDGRPGQSGQRSADASLREMASALSGIDSSLARIACALDSEDEVNLFDVLLEVDRALCALACAPSPLTDEGDGDPCLGEVSR